MTVRSFSFQFFFLLLAFCWQPTLNQLKSQNLALEGETHDHEDEHEDVPPAPNSFQMFNLSTTVPSVGISTQPSDDLTSIFYSPTAGWNSDLPSNGQLAARVYYKNTGTSTLYLQKVVAEWTQSGQAKTKEFMFLDTILPNQTSLWQNARDYQTVGDIFYFDSPVPTKMTFKLYFKNYAGAVIVKRDLKPYNKYFALPFKSGDLKSGELWFGGSTHVGGGQVYAYDWGVVAVDKDGKWNRRRSGTDNSKNENHLIYGEPVYAMADGVVKFSMNDCPDNPKPGVKFDRANIPNSGGGNAFKIEHDGVIALYAHMQKGSLNPKFLAIGSVVKAGDFLGLAGNSGNSDGPHLHVHISKVGSTIRPLVFKNGFCIEMESFPKPVTGGKWSKLANLSLPGYGMKRPLIWPGATKPTYFGLSN